MSVAWPPPPPEGIRTHTTPVATQTRADVRFLRLCPRRVYRLLALSRLCTGLMPVVRVHNKTTLSRVAY